MATIKTSELKPCLSEVMDELQSRFLVNLPASELVSSERLFFQIEQCFWFYEDFYADQYAHLQHVKLNDFARKLFAHCPLLRPLAHRCDELFQDFKAYQRQVPVVGCILLNSARTKLVLVRNWKGTSWTFPRGKVNEGESDIDCARREVLEECGYDVGDGLAPQQFLEFVANDQRMRMYMCTNVPEDYAFAPQTRKEISTIKWFAFDALPKKTWSVMPFMARLKRWVKAQKTKKKSSLIANTSSIGRAASVPRHRPLTLITKGNTQQNFESGQKKNRLNERSVSTPHNDRPSSTGSRKTNRGHFGTEFDTATSYDGLNKETFGNAKEGFSVEEMFTVNERLTGQKFEYDGNPHDFGKPTAPLSTTQMTTTFLKTKGSTPVQILVRPSSAPLNRVAEEKCPLSSPPRNARSTPFGSFKFDAVDIMAVVT
ncbi:mrna-decapping enzyme 2 [Plasmopara halstedii]|uniref:Mrna-decapping enzyme 2 n=1 Tax=Plasmopara halstedii TaxID=4781 RepID=A0A0P1AQI0_PLAHL|nr:mrna-decapping enzyme 2 [Plasmopara halstedii]CEG43589.1 mrna-decapping enzyme 2 [Plasmopara halstedii]|eukprot:XP_024579958.1 mrna-decapping enzyme 2 [Plasmopara halstedii]